MFVNLNVCKSFKVLDKGVIVSEKKKKKKKIPRQPIVFIVCLCTMSTLTRSQT